MWTRGLDMRNEKHCRRIRNPWVIVPVARTGLDLNVTAAMDQSFLSAKDKNPRVVKPVPRSAIQLADSQFSLPDSKSIDEHHFRSEKQ